MPSRSLMLHKLRYKKNENRATGDKEFLDLHTSVVGLRKVREITNVFVHSRYEQNNTLIKELLVKSAGSTSSVDSVS